MSKPFIHLHNHTEYSLLDGATKLESLVKKAIDEGAPAVAITDHGNMYGTIKFYDACVDSKTGNKIINPIIGSEFYVTDDMHKHEGRLCDNKLNHLILLAKTNKGYKNLAKLSSLSFTDGFYYKPRIDLELLSKYSEDLICMSACLAGAIPQYLLAGDYEGAKNYALKLKSMFAEGDFYIEIQDHNIPEQKQTNPLLVKIAHEIGVKVVATNDIHYLEKEDAIAQDVMLCIQTGTYYDDPDRMKFQGSEFYYKSWDEMYENLGWCEEAFETPYEIASKCNVTFEYNHYQLPVFPCPDGLDSKQYLRKIAYEGLERRYGIITDEIRERAEMELSVICDMGFAEYYLLVWDFIYFARSKDIPVGAGRGSGVGSIIAYAIGITNIEPLRYDLIFERFLNRSRTSMPDFDIDFCPVRRGEVIQYVKDKYGADHISQIITFGRMKRKSALKDVSRVFRIPFSEVSKMVKNIPDNFGDQDKKVHIKDLVDEKSPYMVKELFELYNTNENYKKVIDLASKIEGLPRNTGMHAAGVVIYRDVASDTIPLAKNGDEITTQYVMTEVEKLGLLKMDFLALITLTDVKMAHDYVKRETGFDINFEQLGYEDPETYSLLASGNTDAVFQLEGGGMKKFMAKMKPVTLEDIIAGISMYRPGPLQNIDVYLENRKDIEHIKYKHPLLESILKVTCGIIIYQEQAMMITRKLAGYDMTRADSFRAIISKKKMDKIPKEREVFVHGFEGDFKSAPVPGCVANGIPEDVALSIFAEMESFASYAFNKSHAAAYASLSYETAYYKRYYPTEFLAAVLNNRISNPKDTEKYMRILKELNIPLLQPDINKSLPFFDPHNHTIRYGLACIKNIGVACTERIKSEREKNGDFKDLYDFIDRMYGSINKRVLESLIKGGAFDNLGHNRATCLANYEAIFNEIDKKRKSTNVNQYSIFDILGEVEKPYNYKEMKEFSHLDKLFQEKEMLGMYVTGHPLAGYEKEFEKFNFNTSMLPKTTDDDDENKSDDDDIKMDEEVINDNPYNLEEGMDVETGGILSDFIIKRTKDNREMAVCVLEDMYDSIEVVIFARALERVKKLLVKDTLIKIKGKLSYRDGAPKITLSSLVPWTLTDNTTSEDATTEETPEDNQCLCIRLFQGDEYKLDRIDSILAGYLGNSEVKIQLGNNVFRHPRKIKSLELVKKEIIGIVGPNNVIIK